MNIYILRHGAPEIPKESLASKGKESFFLGRTDAPLSEIGYEQARNCIPNVAPLGINKIYSSPLKRAYQTAEVIAQHLGLPITIDERIIEQDFGRWDGRSHADVEAEEPLRRAYTFGYPFSVGPGGKAIPREFDSRDPRPEMARGRSFVTALPEGERHTDVALRAQDFGRWLIANSDESDNILVVAHSIWQRAFMYGNGKLAYDNFNRLRLGYCCWIEYFSFDDETYWPYYTFEGGKAGGGRPGDGKA